ncbi:MAG: hypothetical protein MZU97_02040 [Bacillus subtilis]|nr:hypothetical protein [Bacillus subtilis]
MIKISPSLVENFSRERLTGSILHEMVHASSKNYSSIQEETDAILLDENYLDLFGQGYASEKRENAEEIKEILRNHPSYAELPEYSTGHGIGSNFKSPLD